MNGHVVLAPDKFKGSLRAADVAAHLAAGLRSVLPALSVVQTPVADGGDGTLDAALAAGFQRVPVRVAGPTGSPVDTAYARRDGVAVVELADACGLTRLPDGLLAPMLTSSRGVGEVLRAALAAGCTTVVLGVGGSASTDGGSGLLAALGARLLDADGVEIGPGGDGIGSIDHADLSALYSHLAGARIVLASDVDNPLCGPHGAATVYGPQKGATPAQVERLDAALLHWSAVLAAATTVTPTAHGHPAADEPGAGAAGGVGFAAIAALGAAIRPGIEVMLDLTGLRPQLRGARLAVIAEGSLDPQTLRGKAPAGVARAARAAGVPVVAVAGQVSLSPEQLRAAGIVAAYALSDLEPDLRRSMRDAAALLERVGARLAEEWLADTPSVTPNPTPAGGTR